MTSSMLSGDRRWASSARRGGMTVLGKVVVPKQINLPSQRSENHGLDPTVEIVPKGTLSWGNKSSSAWGSSSLSPNTDGGASSPSHLSGRPSSGSGTRPSTASSDRAYEPPSGPNSRPASASGALTSNQTSPISLRPRSAETRPGSSQLSRFAEHSEHTGAWNGAGTAEKLGVTPPKNDGFSLTSRDFPTLGSGKEGSGKNDLSSHSRLGSSSGVGTGKESIENSSTGDISAGENVKNNNVNSWKRDDLSYNEDGGRPDMEKWQGNSQTFPVPPQHYDAWHSVPMNNPQGGVWFRGPPGGPPYGNPVPPAGFPMEPFPYYRPQIPAAGIPNPQPVPPPGAGPRGPHPKNGDMYRPHMPDAYVQPGMPIRPGFYSGPVAYEGYYGPPMGYCNSNEREVPFMGMAAGPSVYNRYSGEGAPEPGNSHGRSSGYGSTNQSLTGEQVESGHAQDIRGPYKVLLKPHDGWDKKNEEHRSEGAGSEKVGSSSDGGLISMIDHKMEEHSKNLLHVIDGLSVRMCRLENRTRRIEDTGDELKDSSEFNHGRTEGKLIQLENILTEIQGGIQDLRDKHEISEVQLQLTKLQILKSQEKSQDQKTKTNSGSSGQAVVSSIPPQSNQSQPTPVICPRQIPPNPNVSPNTSFHSPPPMPIVGQFPPPVSQSQIPSIPQAEPNYIPHMLSSESAHQHYHMPPIQHPQPTSSTLNQQYQPVPQLPPTSQLQHLPLPHPSCDARDPQARYSSPHNHEEASYASPQNYNAGIQRTSNTPGFAPPSQQTYFGSNQRVYDQPSGGSEFCTEHMQPSRHSSFRDGYPHSGPPSQYISSKMKSPEVPPFSPVLPGENRFSQLLTAQLLPRALPMASDVDSGSGSSGTGKIVPVDDVIDNIVAMGFRRDIVRATVKKMAENGQSVDLNVVLDKLMNGGEVQQGSPRFGW